MRWWYQRNLWCYCFVPLAALFSVVTSTRRFLYKCGFKKVSKLPVPVIIVGNITAGGTGKTPLVIWLANWLRQQGYKPGIVSRGYKSNASYYPYPVDENSNAAAVGDEPLLLARHCACPVVIAPKRVQAAEYLLEHYDCNIIISDDGLQHYALARDIEIVVLDGERRLGNGWLIPVGPLRESGKRLQEVDFIVNNGMAVEGEHAMLLQAKLPQPLSPVTDIEPTSKCIHAVAGIGNPERFFQTLRDLGYELITHEFADHHAYSDADLNFPDQLPIIMTEKDAVKCGNLKAAKRTWYLPVQAVLSEEFARRLRETIWKTHDTNTSRYRKTS